MQLPQIDDYEKLFIENTPMIDVRAPLEFSRGAFPHVKNLPIMNDEERHEVGVCYQQQGQDKAVALGRQLVSADIKRRRVADWESFIRAHPNGVLYCFRGGLRSEISQQWIYEETGLICPRVKGGYKAMRRFLLDSLNAATSFIRPIILGGRTGVGKTVLLRQLRQMVDLERIYYHRGSVFGAHATAQPGQIDAENVLSITLLTFQRRNINRLAFEDESINVGSRRIPENLYDKLKTAPLVVLEASDDERVSVTFDEYVNNTLLEYQRLHGETAGFNHWAEYLLHSLDKIRRRLGGERHAKLKRMMCTAIEAHRERNETTRHCDWIRRLLVDYYDPMYDYQLEKKTDRVAFKGSKEDVLRYLCDDCALN